MGFEKPVTGTKDRTVHDVLAELPMAQKKIPQTATALKAGRVAKPVIDALNYEQEIGTASPEDQRKMEAVLNPETYSDYLEFRELMSPEKREAYDLASNHSFNKL